MPFNQETLPTAAPELTSDLLTFPTEREDFLHSGIAKWGPTLPDSKCKASEE